MYGVTRVDNTNVIEVLKKSEDEYAPYYINGLINGDMVTIVETPQLDTYYNVGELYFKSWQSTQDDVMPPVVAWTKGM